jgi:hypothetical protein
LATLNHYLRVAFGDLQAPDMALAADLAAENVHHALQADLAGLGPVEVMTEVNTADRACAFRVSGPDDSYVDVEVSTVLPYAVVLLPNGGQGSRCTSPRQRMTGRARSSIWSVGIGCCRCPARSAVHPRPSSTRTAAIP